MLYAIIGVFILLIFPISITFLGSINITCVKLCFGAYLFGSIKVFSGKIFFQNKKLLLLDKKGISKIGIKEREKIKAKLKPFYDFNVKKITYQYVISGENISPYAFFIEEYVNSHITSYFASKKSYIKINNYYDVTTYEKENKVNLKIKVLFNLLVVILSLIKTLLKYIAEKINEKKR